MTEFKAPGITPDRLHSLSALALAHLGDAVYELFARTYVLEHGGLTAGGLHRATTALVSAPAQAQAAKRLLSTLTEEELAVFRRGRNAHTRGVPKGASVSDYRLATALEALFGYLYISGAHDRLSELFALCGEEPDAT